MADCALPVCSALSVVDSAPPVYAVPSVADCASQVCGAPFWLVVVEMPVVDDSGCSPRSTRSAASPEADLASTNTVVKNKQDRRVLLSGR